MGEGAGSVSTALSVQQGREVVVQQADTVARNASALGGDKGSFDTAVRIARSLAESTIVPKEYQGNVANVMVALEYANRLQCSVLAVIQNLDVIHGRPALRASFAIATVNATGRFTPIRYRWTGERGTDTWGCIAYATCRETGAECEGPEVTIAIAKKEGWHSKSGSKWQTLPQLMLMYRAGSWWTRVYSPEVLMGLHTSDEHEDMADHAPRRVAALSQLLDADDETAATLAGELDLGDARPRQISAQEAGA
jgi:hypothetical protein